MGNVFLKTKAVARMSAVNVSDMRVSNNADETLVAFSIGSGLGIAIFDSAAVVGGILNFILPDSSLLNEGGSQENMFMFADTGIPSFLSALHDLGALNAHMQIVLAGGAAALDQTGIFDLGRQNYQAAKAVLLQSNLTPQHEAVGGICSRTLRLEIGNGCCTVDIFGRREIAI